MPDALLRLVLWLVTSTLYRIRILGRDNVPEKGGALFVCNHLSFADALLLIASTDRPVRFLMHKDIYEKRWIKPFCQNSACHPRFLRPASRELIHSLQAASDAIRVGEVVCIFAEGQITRIGQLLEFRRGFERIMKNVDAPIIPVALDGVLGSPSSFAHGRMVRRFPRRLPHPVTVSFGSPLPPHGNRRASPGSRPKLDCGRMAFAPRPHGTVATRLRSHGAQTSPPFLSGRRSTGRISFRHRPDQDGFSGASPEKGLGRAGDGGNISAAQRARRAG